MKNKSKNKNKFSLSVLLSNNRILMVISLLIAFGIWIWVAIEKSPEVQKVISGVPVNINMENTIAKQLGLQIFGESQFTVDVTVTGKKYILSALNKDDIVVEAKLNNVDSTGIKTLQLKITAKNESDDFIITSSSSN
ncbi:MAG: CdaR family protein, partial [Candidatus Fimenecus sp.]